MDKLPASSPDESSTFLPAGLHKLKVVSITDWVDKNGALKHDDRGWPGLTVTLKNKDDVSITFDNYYCNVGPTDPKRSNEATRCKSDFYLTRFKNALGFGQEEVPMEKIIGKFLWMPVCEVHYTNADGTPFIGNNGKEMIYNELIKEFYPVKNKEGEKIEYDLPGDPLKGKPIAGIFISKKVKKSSTTVSTSGAAAPPPNQAQVPDVAANQSTDDDIDF